MFKRLSIISLALVLLIILGGAWYFGGQLSAPARAAVGNCPLDLACENIEFPSASGATIKGWYLRGSAGRPTIVLMHGLRSNRLALVDRMRFLRSKGYTVLAFDFLGSGESTGDRLTFGYRESLDAEAAVRFARERKPDTKLGVIGISMGGAAFLLAKDMPPVDAVVLELVYPSMEQAVDNRLDRWLFHGARHFSPLLTAQFPVRLGVSADELRPVANIPRIKVPVLVIGGASDPFTPAEETKQLFDAANEPKQVWIVEGAGHDDLWKFNAREYQNRVLEFFQSNLNDPNAPGGNDETIQSCNCLDDAGRKPDGGNGSGADKK